MATINKLILLLNNMEYIVNDLSKTSTHTIFSVNKNLQNEYTNIYGQYMGSSTCLSGGIVYDPKINTYYKFKLDIIEEMSDNTRNIIVSHEVDFNDIMNLNAIEPNSNSYPSNCKQTLLGDWPTILKLEINNIEIIFILRQLYRFNNEYQLSGIKFKKLK
jgi:hypothetical protein